MNLHADTEFILRIVDIAQQAAKKINAIRQTRFKVKIKKDRSPVTEADQASEEIILPQLRALTPSIPVISEEEMSAGKQVRTGADFWLVDPLDGTKGFINQSDNFTINIGLVKNYEPVLGVVACPAYQEVFYGAIGQGAWKIDRNGQTSRIHVSPPLSSGFRVLTSSSRTNDANLQAFLRHFPVASLVSINSAIKTIRIAEGKADLHPHFNRTMEWDTAAPQAILEAAGGILNSFDNKPLRYGKPNWENHEFFCASVPIDSFLDKMPTP